MFTDPDRTLHVTIVTNPGADVATVIATAWQLASQVFALAPGEPDEMRVHGDAAGSHTGLHAATFALVVRVSRPAR